MSFERIDTTANRLKQAMEQANKKQVDIVRETGIDKGALSSYLKGKYEPKQDIIYKLAETLNVSEMWLWGYDCSMERRPKKPAIVFRPQSMGAFNKGLSKVYFKDDDSWESLDFSKEMQEQTELLESYHKLNDVGEKVQLLTDEKKKVEEQIQKILDAEKEPGTLSLQEVLKDIDNIHNMPLQEQREIVKSLIQKVVIEHDKSITIHWKF